MNAPAKGHAPRRPGVKDDVELNAEGHALLAKLDPAVRPHELPAKYPRIVNRIAELWRRPVEMNKYFDELLVVDPSRQRNGFPLKILTELTALKEYHQNTAFPTGRSAGIWEQCDS